MSTLRSIVALVAVAVIVGQARTERHSAIEPRKWGLPFSSDSEPCTNPGPGLWKPPLQSHRLALVQPFCAGLLVDRAPRARRQGKAGFLRVGHIFDMAKT